MKHSKICKDLTFHKIKKNKKELKKFKIHQKNDFLTEIQFLLDLSAKKEELSKETIQWLFFKYFDPVRSINQIRMDEWMFERMIVKYLDQNETIFHEIETKISLEFVERFKEFKGRIHQNQSKLKISKERKSQFQAISPISSTFTSRNSYSGLFPFDRNVEITFEKEYFPNIEIDFSPMTPSASRNNSFYHGENEFFTSPTSITKIDRSSIDDPLFMAVIDGDVDFLIEFLEINPKEIVKTLKSQSLLHVATLESQIEIMQCLIGKGINVNVSDNLLKTPLHSAAITGNQDAVLCLLGNKAKPNIKDIYGYSPLFLALKKHHWNLADSLVLFGADINFKKSNGMTILHEALATGDEKMLDWVLKQKKVKFNLKDQNGLTPLLISFKKSNLEMLIKLVSIKEVDLLSVDDHQRSMLHYIALHRRTDFLFHLSSNFKISSIEKILKIKDNIKGDTPLHYCVKYGDFQMVKIMVPLLLSSKNNFKDLFLKNSDNQTPYDLSKKLSEKSLGLASEEEFNTQLNPTTNFQEQLKIRNYLSKYVDLQKQNKGSLFSQVKNYFEK
jgi:ankyrin repeat protein